jgi:hypothetical protein
MNTRTEGSLSRLTGRLLIFVWAAILLGATGAKATPVKTLVQDTLYRADGSVAQGKITIRWNAFSTGAGEAVASGVVTETIGSNGGISIPLIPNTGASPSGSYYRVFMKLDDGTTSEEQWVVPAVTTTTVAAIRAKVVPQAVAAQFVSRDYVDTQIAGMGTVANLATPGAIGATTPGTVNATSYAVNGAPLASTNLSDASSLVKTSQANTFSQPQTVVYTGSDTVPAALMVDASNSTIATNPALKVAVPPTGNQEALQAIKGSDSKAWYSLEFNAGGAGLAGMSMGPGGSTGRDTLLYRSGTNALTTPGTLDLQSSITASSPVVDIRAYGAVIDGVTDIGSALAAATAQACTSSGVVFLPCGGSGCYLANGGVLPLSNGKSCTSQTGIQYKLQGMLKLGSTLITPDNTQWMADGNGFGGQFVPRGPNANIQAPAVYGTLGSVVAAPGAVTFTPAMTGGTVAQMPVGSAITVAGNTTCSIATITRNSNGTVTATLQTPQCRIPPGTVITVAGVTGDTTFNTTPMLISSDYPAGKVTWFQTGTADSGTPSTGTITGLNDDSFETVLITANTGTTVTANFAHAHAGTDSFGAVGVMAPYSTFTEHYYQGISVGGNYGAGFWFPHDTQILLDGASAGERAYISSIPIEFASSYNWRITNSSFMPTLSHFCGTSCGQQGYPYGIRVTSLSGAGDPADLNMIVDGNTFVGGGIKVDNNDLTGLVAQMGDLRLTNITIEQPSGYGVIIDPRSAPPPERMFAFNDVVLQDNFWNYPVCIIGYTDPITGGSVAFNPLNGIDSGCTTNPYYGGSVSVNGVDYSEGSLPLPRYLAHVGTLNDGIATETEFRGEGASMGPSLIPYATQPAITNPALWTGCNGTNCTVNTGLEAPDGSATAGELVAGTSLNPRITVSSVNTTTATGDWIIAGVWCMPGVNTTGPCGSVGAFSTYQIYSGSTADTFDNTGAQFVYPSSYESAYYSDWWHPVVSAHKITGTGSGTAHSINMYLEGPQTAGVGIRFWQPFFIYIPVSAKPASMTTAQWDGEIARWRQWLMHGVVPPGMPAGVLAINPTLKMMWGSDTNLYRGAAGVVQTDGTFNAASGYQVNGSALNFSNIAGTPSTTQVPVQSITTTGTSGAATLSGGVLNIPQYAGGLSGNIAESQVTNLTTDLAAKAPLASPTFTGTPTAPTQAITTNNTDIATTAAVTTALGSYVPTSTTVNGHALSSNVTLGVADLGASYGADITSNGGVLDSDGTHATSLGCHFYGDSITAGIGSTVQANAYANLLTTRLCGGVATNYGVSGMTFADGAYQALTHDNPGDSNDPAVTTLFGTNDAYYYTATATNKVSTYQFEGAMAAWLALSSTNKVLANNTTYVTQGGAAWAADSTFADAHGLTTTGTSTLTDSACYVGPKGALYLWYYLYGTSTGTFTVTVDGTTQTDTITGNSTLSAQYQSNAPRNGEGSYTSAGLARFTGLTNGVHSCVVNASGSSGNPVGMIAFGFPPTNRIRSPLGPNVYMGGVVPTAAGYGSSANVLAYNGWTLGLSTLLIGDGLPVKFVDVYDSMDSYLDFLGTAAQNCPAVGGGNYGLHPNDCGHNKLFDVFATSIKPTTIIGTNQGSANPGQMWNWNPGNIIGSAGLMAPGETLYCSGSNCSGHTFGGLNQTAGVYAAQPAQDSELIFSGGGTIGTSFCTGGSTTNTLANFNCPVEFFGNYLYILPTSTSDASSGANQPSTYQFFRGRGWNGSSAGNEDYDLQTMFTGAGSSADSYLAVTNYAHSVTGGAGVWVRNSSNHGLKLKAGNTTYDATLDTTPLTAATTVQTPAGWTGTVSLEAGLNLPNGTPTYTAGTNVTSVSCASGYTCTNTRGELTIVGGTATTGTIATVDFSAALSAAPGLCRVTQNGGSTFFGIGEGQPTTAAFAITAGSSVASSTVTVDYLCIP